MALTGNNSFILPVSTTGADGGPVFVTGLTQANIKFVRVDNESTEVAYGHFTDRGQGMYEVGDFQIPNVALDLGTGQWSQSVVGILPKINDVIQRKYSRYSAFNGSCSAISTQDLYVRMDKLGDTALGWFTYDISLSGVNGFNPFNPPVDGYYRFRIPAAGWVIDTISASLSSITIALSSITSGLSAEYVTLGTNQTITNKKTFQGGTNFNLGTSGTTAGAFRIETASNPPNGGIVALDVGYQANNVPRINASLSEMQLKSLTAESISSITAYLGHTSIYKPSAVTSGNPVLRVRGDITFTGLPTDIIKVYGGEETGQVDFGQSTVTGQNTWKLSDLKIPTSSSKYITGSLVNDDYAHVKWISDNFQSINSSYQSKTVYVDSSATEDVELKTYKSLSGAVAGITENGVTTSANIWSIIVRQHPDISGYYENVEIPDWMNIIGQGMINIFGQLTRPASSETQVTSKIQNLIFTNGGFDHAVERFEAVECVFITADNIDLERSIMKGCEFYASAILSSGNNKTKGCFFNKSVAWQSSDVVRSPDYLIGATYS